MNDDVLSTLRVVSRDEDTQQTDKPDPPDSKRDAAEMKRQLDDEREHGHPAWEVSDDG